MLNCKQILIDCRLKEADWLHFHPGNIIPREKETGKGHFLQATLAQLGSQSVMAMPLVSGECRTD